MPPRAGLLACTCAGILGSAVALLDDANVFLQSGALLADDELGAISLADVGHEVDDNIDGNTQASSRTGSWATHQGKDRDVVQVQAAPLVHTHLGTIKGYHDNGFDVFKAIPYAEPPGRFQPAKLKTPWAPQTLVARDFGSPCIGANTGAEESEDCLTLNLWRPQGDHKDLPVILYIHGGSNMRGSGEDPLRQGDLIVQSKEHPAIFITFNYRLGLLGWIKAPPMSTIFSDNLGFNDQQKLMQWVNWNINAFGGSPTRVTLMAEGDAVEHILAHLASPSSGGFFSQVAIHSPTVDRWSRTVNSQRTLFMLSRFGCMSNETKEVYDCLMKIPAENFTAADWSIAALSQNPGSTQWFQNYGNMLAFSAGRSPSQISTYEGWHVLVDQGAVPEEPKDMIATGKWNKVPVFITVAQNESRGVFKENGTESLAVVTALGNLLQDGALKTIRGLYNQTLQKAKIFVANDTDLMHMMMTDKLWTCEARALADFVTRGGGKAYVNVFTHSPKYDPAGAKMTRSCQGGSAACAGADILYLLPQGRNIGIHGGEDMKEDIEVSHKYSRDFLAFVSGSTMPWKQFTEEQKSMTLYDSNGARLVPGFKGPQCDVLDTSFNSALPDFLKKQGLGHWINLFVRKPLEASELRLARVAESSLTTAAPPVVQEEAVATPAPTRESRREVRLTRDHHKRSPKKTVSSVN